MATLGALYRYFTVVVNHGSGCLIQPKDQDYTYVLTVKHNLLKDESTGEFVLNVSRTYPDFRQKKYLKVLNYFEHDEHDYMIIKVEKIVNPKNFKLYIDQYKNDTKGVISGFPNYLRGQNNGEYRISLNVEIEHERTSGYERDLVLSDNPNSFESGAAENIIGLSGSGIFYEKNDNLYLCGIFPKLNDSRGTHHKVVGFDLSGFHEITKKNNLTPITQQTLWWKYSVIAIFVLTILGYFIFNPVAGNGVGDNEIDVTITKPVPIIVPETRIEKPKKLIKKDTLLNGSIEFFDHPNQQFNLTISPYHKKYKDERVVPIKNINRFIFNDTVQVLEDEIFLNIKNDLDIKNEWIVFKTGENFTEYEPNIKLFFRKKDDYYASESKIILNDLQNSFNKIDTLTNLSWMIDDEGKWYYLNTNLLEYFIKKRKYNELCKKCENLVEDHRFEKLNKNKADFLILIWRKGLRKYIEQEFKNLDFIYSNIGRVTLRVIGNQTKIKKELKELLNQYNRIYGKQLMMIEEDLIFLLDV
ncbi:MAG: hypothetical protein WAT79_13315 [Saprospiraceae bacterium]